VHGGATGGGLTSGQRRWLRGEAHGLSPLVQVGGKGVTAAVAAELDRALAVHELVKVRLAGERDERRAAAEELAGRAHAELVGLVGRVATLYRRHPDPESRRYQLPG
jgi:RNA-binding protein